MSLGSLIAYERARQNLTLQQVADRVGVSYPAVQQWEKAKTEPSRENARKLAEALDVPVSSIENCLVRDEANRLIDGPLSDDKLSNHDLTTEIIRAAANRERLDPVKRARTQIVIESKKVTGSNKDLVYLENRIPVMGVLPSLMTDVEGFFFNGNVIEYVSRPPGLSYADEAYAIYIPVDSMYPKYEPHDIIFINPERIAARNDYVLIELHSNDETVDGFVYIAKYLKRTKKFLEISIYNPDTTLGVNVEQIKGIHRIVPLRELLGI